MKLLFYELPSLAWAALAVTGTWFFAGFLKLAEQEQDWLPLTASGAVTVLGVFMMCRAGQEGVRMYRADQCKVGSSVPNPDAVIPPARKPLGAVDLGVMEQTLAELVASRLLAPDQIAQEDFWAFLRQENPGAPLGSDMVLELLGIFLESRAVALPRLLWLHQGTWMTPELIAADTAGVLRVLGYRVSPDAISVSVPDTGPGDCNVSFRLLGETRVISCLFYNKYTPDGLLEALDRLRRPEDGTRLHAAHLGGAILVAAITPEASAVLNAALPGGGPVFEAVNQAR